MKFTTSDGAEYILDDYGIHQLNPKPFVYDTNYCAVYDAPERKAKSDQLQALRLGVVQAAYGVTVSSILDYGCGNYAFLNYVKDVIDTCDGYDISDYPVPVEVRKIENLNRFHDVVTFFDCLEHIPDVSFVRNLNCDMVVISAPDARVTNVMIGDPKAMTWFDHIYPHRKPGEHLHHWDVNHIQRLMNSMGWNMIYNGHPEDKIRKREYPRNIFTAAFKRK